MDSVPDILPNYDDLLMSGHDRAYARFEVEAKVSEVLDRWRVPAPTGR